MTLRELQPGQIGNVVAINAEGAFKRRIMDMGITAGVTVKLIRIAPLGDPIEVTLRGYQLSLRKDEAASIQVE